MEEGILKIWFSDNKLSVMLNDGEILTKYLEVFPALFEANEEERGNYFLYNDNRCIRCDEIDEDICIEDLRAKYIVNYDNEVNAFL